MCVVDHTCNPSTLEVEEGWLEIEDIPVEVTATHKSREAKGRFLLILVTLVWLWGGGGEPKKKHLNRRSYLGMQFY